MLTRPIRLTEGPSLASGAAKVALLGSGTVGAAVLDRLASGAGTPFGGRLNLVFAANTRLSLFDPEELNPQHCAEALSNAPRGERRTSLADLLAALGSSGTRILIDATADGEVAANHPALLMPECMLPPPAS